MIRDTATRVLSVMSIFGKRYTQKFNSADFDDEDCFDMLEAIEALCDIELMKEEVGNLTSVGDLYDLLKAKIEMNPTSDPLWSLICKMIREYSSMRDAIDRDTTLFRQGAKERH